MLKPGTVVEILKTCPWNKEGDLPLGIVVGNLDPKDKAVMQRKEVGGEELLVCPVCVVCTMYMPGLGPNEKMYFLQEEMLKVIPAEEVPDVVMKVVAEEDLMATLLESIGVVPPADDGAMGQPAPGKPHRPEDPSVN